VKADAESKERAILETELNERKRAAEEIQRRLEFEETIAKVSSRFVGISDLDIAIRDSLADIGVLSRASRSYLFLLNGENKTMDNIQDWYAAGVNQPINKLKIISYELYPEWVNKLNNGKLFTSRMFQKWLMLMPQKKC